MQIEIIDALIIVCLSTLVLVSVAWVILMYISFRAEDKDRNGWELYFKESEKYNYLYTEFQKLKKEYEALKNNLGT